MGIGSSSISLIMLMKDTTGLLSKKGHPNCLWHQVQTLGQKDHSQRLHACVTQHEHLPHVSMFDDQRVLIAAAYK